jgi:hypothetical protein
MIKIGNTYFDKSVKQLSLKEFKEIYKGRLDVDLTEAYKKIKKSK